MTPAVHERPIIFSGSMILAILQGRKTQTRRMIKGHPHAMKPLNIGCPHGTVGDRLWVKETIRGGTQSISRYNADGGELPAGPEECTIAWRKLYDQKWPAIYMPRWASRITLELTSVRVERLQDISEEDARAEGVDDHRPADGDQNGLVNAAQYYFERLWDRINGKRCPWASNPWVWALEFRKVSP
jgi:hypothetical protein